MCSFYGLYPTSCAECMILTEIFWQINGRKVIDSDGIFAIIQTETVKTIQTQAKTCNRRDKDVGRGAAFPHHEAAEPAAHCDGAGALRGAGRQRVHHPPRFERAGQDGQGEQGDTAARPCRDSQFLADEPTMAAKEALAVVQKKCIAKATAALITAEDFVFLAPAAPRWRWPGS